MTAPRPIKVFDPSEEIVNLYNLLVCDNVSDLLACDNEPGESKSVVLRKAEIVKQFNTLLKAYNIEDKVIKNYTVNLKLFNEVTFPFAFQNGLTNVIKPVPFSASNLKENLKTACQLAVENDELNNLPDPIRLHVVASFRSDQPESIEQVSKVLETYHVELHSTNNLELFIKEIKEQAH